MHLPDPDAWFASPVFISIEPDGPELANEVTSGLSMTIPPDVEDELEPDTKAAVPTISMEPPTKPTSVDGPAARYMLPPTPDRPPVAISVDFVC